MSVVWMVQVPVHQVVRVASVRHRGVTTTSSVDVSAVVGAARVVRGTAGRVGVALGELMAVRVSVVGVVQVPVVEVVHVVLVNDRGMSAAGPVRVGMLVVSLVHDESLIQQMMNYRSLWGMSSVSGPRSARGQIGALPDTPCNFDRQVVDPRAVQHDLTVEVDFAGAAALDRHDARPVSEAQLPDV